MMRELPMLTSQHTQPANDLSLANSVHAAASIRRAVFFGEAHRFQTLQQPRVQSNTDVAKITMTLQRLVREVAKEVHTPPGVLRRAITTSLFDIHGADIETKLPPFACALIQQFLQERQLGSAICTPHDRHMIRVWTAQGLRAMVMWHITLHAQWHYHHTTWNALDLNARPRGSYRRIDLFMNPPPNTSTTTFDRSLAAVPGTNAESDMYHHYVEPIVSLLPLTNTEWQHMDRSIGGHSKISRYVLQ